MNSLIVVASIIAAGLAVGLAYIGPGVGQGYSRLGRFSSTYLRLGTATDFHCCYIFHTYVSFYK
jgi:hypothetical protein